MSKPTLSQLKEMFASINKEHFQGRISDFPILWNNRLRTCAGKCVFKRRTCKPIRIELSDKLFKNNNYDIDKITRTLIHEMTHAYLLEHFQERGHTDRFQMTMMRITGEYKNHRCHNYDTTGLKNKAKYTVMCPVHGQLGTRNRRPKSGGVYRCSKCKSVVKFEAIIQQKDNFWGIGD